MARRLLIRKCAECPKCINTNYCTLSLKSISEEEYAGKKFPDHCRLSKVKLNLKHV